MTHGDLAHRARPVVVVGASAGGVEALRSFVGGLPGDISAPVLVVLHVPPNAPSALPSILARVSVRPVRHALHGEPLEAGTIFVAPPDHHLMVVDGALSLTRGPQENGHRPAVDVLFRSAARMAGPQAIGVVLSGSLDDGAAGAHAITSRGGRVMVQDPEEALYASMPEAAARAAGVDVRLAAEEMGGMLTAWLDELASSTPTGAPVTTTMEVEVDMADLEPEAVHSPERPGVPAGFGCPDCAGALYQIDEGSLRRYRCRVGHAWSAESLLARQSIAMESALWMALRSLEERAALNIDMGRQAGARGHDLTAARFEESAQETLRAAELVRRLIDEIGAPFREEGAL
ncbi:MULTISPECIES: chemotaxis protein CheB [unclassified Nocardioides]|uniref:chemotaxis protein CheB n=1 Tax=unclassified Nocardioides TaxID=2615069 RepID=UPI003623D656